MRGSTLRRNCRRKGRWHSFPVPIRSRLRPGVLGARLVRRAARTQLELDACCQHACPRPPARRLHRRIGGKGRRRAHPGLPWWRSWRGWADTRDKQSPRRGRGFPTDAQDPNTPLRRRPARAPKAPRRAQLQRARSQPPPRRALPPLRALPPSMSRVRRIPPLRLRKTLRMPRPSRILPKLAIPAQQAAVESELKQGKVVLVLFWNPKGSDDLAVHKELQVVSKQLGGKIAVHDALANQVGAFGSITKRSRSTRHRRSCS